MTDDRLELLLAKQEIAEVLADFARGADRIDVDLIKSVFHDDAEIDAGSIFAGSGDEYAEFLGVVHPSWEAHHHALGQMVIRVDGDRAGSETYVIARLRLKNTDGSIGDVTALGRYADEWQRRDGRWRIRRRRYLHDIDEMRTSSGGEIATLGTRDRTDPSYDVLALRTSAED